MHRLRLQSDAIIWGANNLRVWKKAIKGSSTWRPLQVILTRSGDLPEDLPFWNESRVLRFVFTTQKSFAKTSERVRDRAFVIAAGESEIDLQVVLNRLRESGVKKLLIEGGGETLCTFLDQSLVQELFLTWTPRIIGGAENPSLAGSLDLVRAKGLKILKMQKVKSELFLHLKVTGARGV